MFTIFLGLTPFIFITFVGFVFGKLKILVNLAIHTSLNDLSSPANAS